MTPIRNSPLHVMPLHMALEQWSNRPCQVEWRDPLHMLPECCLQQRQNFHRSRRKLLERSHYFTDHWHLLILFCEYKGPSILAATHIQRWLIILSACDCNIVYRKSEEHNNADGLYHCPLPQISNTGTTVASATNQSLLAEHLQKAPVNATSCSNGTHSQCASPESTCM